MSRSLPRVVAAAAAVAVGLAGATAALGATAPPVGPRPDGTAVTPGGHRVTPAGRQTRLGDLPLGQALSPDGRTLLVSNDGQGLQSLQVVDVASGRVMQTLPYASPQSLYVGLAWSRDGRQAYASGGGDQTVRRYAVSGGRLRLVRTYRMPATGPDGRAVTLFPTGLAVTPNGRRLVVADQLADAVSTLDLGSGIVQTTAVGHAPRSVTMTGPTTAAVTDSGGATVSFVDVGAAPRLLGQARVGTHPVAAVKDPRSTRLYVADGESDSVTVLDSRTRRRAYTFDLAPYRGAPAGSSPTDLALSADGGRLFVTAAGEEAVVVVDTRSGRVAGRLPVGWYPTGVLVTGRSLLVLNAKGLGAGPNDGTGHPDPTSPTKTAPDQYSGSMIVGTLSTVPLPDARTLAAGTRQVGANHGAPRPGNGRPVRPDVKHVIYVVGENRTFDQVFGDLGKGDGDPSLQLFGDESAPNQRALQRDYTTYDAFFADAEISAQGWNWTTAAGSPLYTESLWPSNYSGRGAPYPSENGDPAIAPNRDPKNAYLWDRLSAAGVSFRNYGFYVKTAAGNVNTAFDPVLDARTAHAFRGFDMACPDNGDTFAPRKADCGTPRYDVWKAEFDRYVADGNLPTVQLVRLPTDHTSGTKPGFPTPRAYVADHDLALGRLVEAVTHSPYAKDTVIVQTEDDAQDGPDHVDAHRTLAQVISPWTRTGRVDSTRYDTASMLRTIEDLVGIGPMTQADAAATPMTGGFTREPDQTPYAAVRPPEAGDASNASTAPMARQSLRMDLTSEDRADPVTMNRAVWKSVHGATSEPPAPRGGSGDPEG